MHIPGLGPVTRDEELGWLHSPPHRSKLLPGGEVRFVLAGYEDEPNPEDFHAAIQAFLMLGPEALAAAAPHVFAYYQDMNANWAPSSAEYVRIASPGEVWDRVQFGDEAYVCRRKRGDRGVYVALTCGCDWEPEHGLQLVFRDGRTLSRVGSADGHLTNADAYGDASLEQVIYRPIA